jgi:hypothetical protein
VIEAPGVLLANHWSPLRGRIISLSFIVVPFDVRARATVDRRRRLSIAWLARSLRDASVAVIRSLSEPCRPLFAPMSNDGPFGRTDVRVLQGI